MINVETKYFSLNKIFLLAVGLWPYKQSNFTRFQYTFLFIILTTNPIFQCTVFISRRCTPELIIKILSSTFFFATFVIQYSMFSVKAVKNLLEQLIHVYNEVKDEKEIAIIDKYGRISKHSTILFTVLCLSVILACTIESFWSDILDIILPKNLSRSHRSLIMTEYFIDEEKYFYFIILHFVASTSIGMVSTLAIGAMFFSYLQHICGVFKIASYRIERAMNIDMLRNINIKKHIVMFKGLVCAIDIHRQALKLSKLVQYSCETMMFYLIIFGVITVSLNLFRISSSNEEFVLPFVFAFISIVYMFLANYIGQIITNHNHHVFFTAYNVQWYMAPLHIQRIILFLLQRESKTFNLTVGGLFIASIECFATLVKTSVSYFTVIYSTR